MDGLPLTRAQRPSVAWYGDMSLLPHILNFLKASKTEVTLKFHTPVSMDEFKNRRQLSTHCHNIIAKGVEDVIYNRSKQ
jgi:1-acyl-sn-glycerol-3-phosphate acyltransferase